MIITTSYLTSLVGKKLQLLKTTYSELKQYNIGRIVRITSDGQFLVHWFDSKQTTRVDPHVDEYKLL